MLLSSAVSGGLERRAVNYETEVLPPNVQWFLQYSGFGESTVLSLYTRSSPNLPWRKYMKAKHVLDIKAEGGRVLIMCKSADRKKDFKVAGFVDSFSYADVNEELNNEGENIRLLNGVLLHYCITYCETNKHMSSIEERAVMIQNDYKDALQRVKVIVDEAKEARLEEALRKKRIRDGKRKDPADGRSETSRKKTRPDVGDAAIVDAAPSENIVAKKGKKKVVDDSPFLELEKIPKRSPGGPPDKSVGDRLMDMEHFKNKYKNVWIFGEGVNGFVSIDNIERGDAGYNCRPISDAHLKEMKTWLFNFAFMQKSHPNHLTIVPADRRRKPTSFDEVKNKKFHVVNGQHTLAACHQYVNDPSSTNEVKRFFSKWPCNVVWAPEGDDDPLFHLSGVLNLDSEYMKHFPSFTECIQHARKTWIRRGRPERCVREKVNNAEAFKKWKVNKIFNIETYLNNNN